MVPVFVVSVRFVVWEKVVSVMLSINVPIVLVHSGALVALSGVVTPVVLGSLAPRPVALASLRVSG